MELVIDANILFSALIKEGAVRYFLLLSGHSFYAPEFVFDEIHKHIIELQDKTGISAGEIKSLLDQIITMANIKIIPFTDFEIYKERAKEISPDIDDVHYFALALKLRCPIWSNDKKLKEQDIVKVYNTEETLGLK